MGIGFVSVSNGSLKAPVRMTFIAGFLTEEELRFRLKPSDNPGDHRRFHYTYGHIEPHETMDTLFSALASERTRIPVDTDYVIETPPGLLRVHRLDKGLDSSWTTHYSGPGWDYDYSLRSVERMSKVWDRLNSLALSRYA